LEKHAISVLPGCPIRVTLIAFVLPMIVVIRPHTPPDLVEEVIREISLLGYTPNPIRGECQTVVAAIGDETTHASLESLNALAQVERVIRVQKRYKLASRQSHPETTVVDAGGVKIGGPDFVLMAGPCSVENEEQLMVSARAVKAAGATVLRGGAYKPRTSPYEFQGLGPEGLRMLAAARAETGLRIITEVLGEHDVESERTFAGARHARDHRKLAVGNGKGEVFEIVFAGTLDA
jgi:3-deoxy-7-phosphoheptulonate synthase